MKAVTLLVLCLALTASAASAAANKLSAAEAERTLVGVFVFRDTGGWMGCGFVVGDGSWVVTTADLVTEVFGPEAKADVNHVTVLSAFTGDAYDGQVKVVDRKVNLALIKLPVNLPAAPLAPESAFKRARSGSLGQLLSGEYIGTRWDTWIYALARETAPKKPARLAVKKWQARNAIIVESKGARWLFISRADPQDNSPRASLVWREDGGAVGLYNGRLVVEGGKNPPSYGQCLTSVQIARFAEKAGVDRVSLQQPPESNVKPDAAAAQGLQNIWAALSDIILGRWSDAEKSAAELVKVRKDSALAHLLLGVSLAGGGKVEDGVKSMDRAISLAPSMDDAYFSRGTALASLNKPKEAEADFKKAAELRPNDVRPLIALAQLLAQDKNRLGEAAQTAQKAAQISPEHPRARMTLALILRAQGNLDQAASELRAALKVSPDWGAAKAALAAVYEAQGKNSDAEKLYRELAKVEPKNPDALFALASFLADHDKKEEARKLIPDILALNPPKELETAVKELEKKLQ